MSGWMCQWWKLVVKKKNIKIRSVYFNIIFLFRTTFHPKYIHSLWNWRSSSHFFKISSFLFTSQYFEMWYFKTISLEFMHIYLDFLHANLQQDWCSRHGTNTYFVTHCPASSYAFTHGSHAKFWHVFQHLKHSRFRCRGRTSSIKSIQSLGDSIIPAKLRKNVCVFLPLTHQRKTRPEISPCSSLHI